MKYYLVKTILSIMFVLTDKNNRAAWIRIFYSFSNLKTLKQSRDFVVKSFSLGIHPFDLILRELAFFEFQTGDKSLALKYIRKSRNSFNLEKSNISIWLKVLIDIHEDFFKGNLKAEKEYFNLIPDNDLLGFITSDNTIKSFIKKIRYFSPY